MMRTLALVLFALLGWIAVAPALAHAQGSAHDQRARVHFQAGTNYFQVAEYEDALREYARAYELSQRPELLYNIYLCHERLANLEPAIEYLTRYLREVEQIEARAILEARLATMQTRLARERAAEAEATSRGERRGEAETDHPPAEAETAPPSEAPAETAVAAEAERAGEAADGGEVASEQDGETASTPPPETATPPREASGGFPVGAAASFAVAGVGLATFGIAGALALGEDASLEQRCSVERCSEGDLEGLRATMIAADVGLAVGVAAAVTGLVIALVDGGGSDERDESATLSPWVSPTGAGAALGVRF